MFAQYIYLHIFFTVIINFCVAYDQPKFLSSLHMFIDGKVLEFRIYFFWEWNFLNKRKRLSDVTFRIVTKTYIFQLYRDFDLNSLRG